MAHRFHNIPSVGWCCFQHKLGIADFFMDTEHIYAKDPLKYEVEV